MERPKLMKKIRLLFVTGSRGEWGYIRPILKLIQKSNQFSYELCVTNMHLLPSFGNSYKEIENDGFKINCFGFGWKNKPVKSHKFPKILIATPAAAKPDAAIRL